MPEARKNILLAPILQPLLKICVHLNACRAPFHLCDTLSVFSSSCSSDLSPQRAGTLKGRIVPRRCVRIRGKWGKVHLLISVFYNLHYGRHQWFLQPFGNFERSYAGRNMILSSETTARVVCDNATSATRLRVCLLLANQWRHSL